MTTSPSIRTGTLLGERLARLTSPEQVRAVLPEEALAAFSAAWFVAPASEQELANVLGFANAEGLSVMPSGGGTKLGWGTFPARADVALSLARLNRVLEHAWADQTVVVEAGCTIGHLQSVLSSRGQCLAVDPLWLERATVGGMLSTNDAGTLRFSFGGLRDLIIGSTLVLADGTIAKSGGKVVKNVAGYDLSKLVTGAFGTLGVITRAVFRLHPNADASKVFSLTLESLDQAQTMLRAIADANLTLTRLQLRAGSDSPLVLDLGLEGSQEGIDAQEQTIRCIAAPLTIRPGGSVVWNARQELFADSGLSIVVKCSVPPASTTAMVTEISRLVSNKAVLWHAAIQASGIGWIGFGGPSEKAVEIVMELRLWAESAGGSLVVLSRSEEINGLDVWGSAGDALPLMRALKRQFDPRNTLNPGRFLGGI